MKPELIAILAALIALFAALIAAFATRNRGPSVTTIETRTTDEKTGE